jgi:predicted ATPase
MALSTEQGFASRLVWGMLLRGWALAEQGQGEEGLAQMREGLAARHASGLLILAPDGAMMGVGDPSVSLGGLFPTQPRDQQG